MDNVPLYLDEKLQYWVSRLNLKFTYNDCITIDLLDYFPLLKQGKTLNSTIRSIITIYTLFYKDMNKDVIVEDQLFFDTFNENINMYFYNNKYKQNLGHQLSNQIRLFDKISFQTIEECERDLINELMIESISAKELWLAINTMKKYVDVHISHNLPYNRLCELLIALDNDGKNLVKVLLQRLLSNDHIGLIYAILNNDVDKVHEYLYVKDIDPRLGNNELHKLCMNEDSDAFMMISKINKEKSDNEHLINMFTSVFTPMISIFDYTDMNIVQNIAEDVVKTSKFIPIPEMINFSVEIDISDMIFDVTIERNLLEKQVLIDNFSDLIGPSTISDNIFNYLDNFR